MLRDPTNQHVCLGASVDVMDHFHFLFSKTQESWEVSHTETEFWEWMWEGSDFLDFTVLDLRASSVHLAMYFPLNIFKSVHENKDVLGMSEIINRN